MDWAISLSDIIVSLSILGTGIFCKQYLIKSADFKAAEANIDKLVEQLKKTTKATKTIEAKINNDAWLEQQKWQVKKDFYMEAMKLFHTVKVSFDVWLFAEKQICSNKHDIDSLNEFEREKDSAYESIVSNQKLLDDMVELVGVLFLEQSVISKIKVFTHAEFNRVKEIKNEISNNEMKTDPALLNYEIDSFSLYFYNLMNEFAISHSMFTQSAKKDLNFQPLPA
jgi:hypothetical protein